MPAVSIVLPVHNVGRYLHQCLDSILAQSFQGFEAICIDDGSTDESGSILDGYAARDQRIRVIHQANAGVGPARNAGVDMATGDYLCFCDADDWCSPRLLEELLKKAVRCDADLVFCSFFKYDEEDRVFGRYRPVSAVAALAQPFAPEQMRGWAFHAFPNAPWGKLIRRRLVVDRKLRFPPLQRAEDECFSICAIACARRIAFVDKALYHYRDFRPGSATSCMDERALLDFAAMDLARRFLVEHAQFSALRLDWAYHFFCKGVSVLQRMASSEALDAYYRKLRELLSGDEDWRTLRDSHMLSDSQRAIYEIFLAYGDPGVFLLDAIQRLKRANRSRAVRRWRILGKIPENLLPFLYRFK